MNPGVFSEVCRTLLGEGKPVRFRAGGSSMTPAIRDGDLLTVEPKGERPVSVGDVVIYASEGHLIAHRIRSHDRRRQVVICQGDNRFFARERLPEAAILGRVAKVGDTDVPARRRQWRVLLTRTAKKVGRSIEASIESSMAGKRSGVLESAQASEITGKGTQI